MRDYKTRIMQRVNLAAFKAQQAGALMSQWKMAEALAYARWVPWWGVVCAGGRGLDGREQLGGFCGVLFLGRARD